MDKTNQLSIEYFSNKVEVDLGIWATDMINTHLPVSYDTKMTHVSDLIEYHLSKIGPKYLLQIAFCNIELATDLFDLEIPQMGMTPIELIKANLSVAVKDLVLESRVFNKI